jgi:hypothetical protein
VVILFPLFWLSSHALCWSEQDDTKICFISISAFVRSSNRRTTHYERAIRESIDARSFPRRHAGRRQECSGININDLDLDLELFSLVHHKAHDDERDRSYERETPVDEAHGVVISPVLRIVAVMAVRDPLVVRRLVLLPES